MAGMSTSPFIELDNWPVASWMWDEVVWIWTVPWPELSMKFYKRHNSGILNEASLCSLVYKKHACEIFPYWTKTMTRECLKLPSILTVPGEPYIERDVTRIEHWKPKLIIQNGEAVPTHKLYSVLFVLYGRKNLKSASVPIMFCRSISGNL